MKKRMRWGALALTLTLLAGCGPAASSPTPTATPTPPEELRLTREELPILDGSTSTAPLARAVCSVLLGEPIGQVTDLVNFSKTTASYRSLMNGQAQLLIAAEPAPTVVTEKEEQGFQWEMAPIATDALVFLVNESNPVDSLTHEELLGIYTGEITNWKQVGGEDRAIIPFQRNAESGSQTLMEKLVMGDVEPMEPLKEYVVGSMEGLIEAVRSFDGSPGAIGYTVYYYANDMNMADGLKVVAVEGNKPDADTIRSGAYPFTNPYYAVIAASAMEHSAARRIFDWLQGSVGQSLIAHEGYVSILKDYATVDWEVGETQTLVEQYTRLSREPLTQLVASKKYGPLLPYVGGTLIGEWWNYDLYGLVTRDGTIVVDPVYSSVWQLRTYDESWTNLPIYALGKAVEVEGQEEPQKRYALAAMDGSWVTGFDYLSVEAIAADRIWAVVENGDGLMLTDTLKEIARVPLPEGAEDWLFRGGNEGATGWNQGVGVVMGQSIISPEGTLISGEEKGLSHLSQFSDGLATAGGKNFDQDGLWGYLNPQGEWVLSPRYSFAGDFRKNRAIVTNPQGFYQVIDKTGTVLLESGDQIMLRSDGDRDYYIAYQEQAENKYLISGVYDQDLKPVDSPLTGNSFDWGNGEWFSRVDEGSTTLAWPTRTATFPMVGEAWESYDWGCIFYSKEGDRIVARAALDWEGNPMLEAEDADYLGTLTDQQTGEQFLYVQKGQRYQIYTLAGEFLMETPGWPSIQDGLAEVRTDLSFGYKSLDGDWVFRISLAKSGED